MGFLSRLFFGGDKPPSPRCVACQSEDLTTLAPFVYRCNGCGHEGGKRYAEYYAAQNRDRLAALSDAELRQRLVANFEACRRSVLATLPAESGPPEWDILHGGSEETHYHGPDYHSPDNRRRHRHGIEDELRDQRMAERDKMREQARNELAGARNLLSAWRTKARPPAFVTELSAMVDSLMEKEWTTDAQIDAVGQGAVRALAMLRDVEASKS